MSEFSLENYLTNGVINIVKGIWKASLKNPGTSLFMIQYMKANTEANRLRKKAADNGEHIPPFLIASITTKCNLNCTGCYARANSNYHDGEPDEYELLSEKDWNRIFSQAEELGISFILLAGGEPMLRTDVLKAAGLHKKIIFPVFTNGTLFTEEVIKILTSNPNILPVLSLEGNADTTDSRRGNEVFKTLLKSMKKLKDKGLIFGASVTVQKNNLEEVFSENFINMLAKEGCKSIIYVEYVPVSKETASLAPSENDRIYAENRLNLIRKSYPEMLFVSFPGDEKASGGCLAAGRGFFHINAYGGAEPCPFSPHSDTNLKNVSLKEALQSPLFMALQNSGALTEYHDGGCVLFEKEEQVKSLCKGQ